MSGNTNNVTMPEAIMMALQSYMSEVNVCLPGSIVRIVDVKKRKISVQPEIKKVYLDKEELEPPIIENVPLKYTGGSKAVLQVPITIGDKVILVFSQRSLDNWLTSGKMAVPGHRRFFDLSDCFAIPGLQSFKEDHPLIENNVDTALLTENNKIVIKSDGEIEIGGTNLDQLVKKNFLDKFFDHVHNFIAAPSGTFTTSKPASITPTAFPTPVGGALTLFGMGEEISDYTQKVSGE